MPMLERYAPIQAGWCFMYPPLLRCCGVVIYRAMAAVSLSPFDALNLGIAFVRA